MTSIINPLTIFALLMGLIIAYWLALRLAKEPSFGLYLMAFFLPFERIPSLDLLGFTFKINHYLAFLTGLFCLLAIAFNHRKIAPNALAIPLCLMFFSYLITGLTAEDSFRQSTVYISLLIMLGIYLVTINTLTSKTVLQNLVPWILLSAGLMSIISLYQFFGDLAGLSESLTGLDPGYTKSVFGFPRVHAFSKEPLYFANYLFIPLGIALTLFLGKHTQRLSTDKSTYSQNFTEKIWQKIDGPWLLPLIGLLLIIFFLTLSRGAFIALVPFSLTIIVFYAKQIFSLKNITLGLITVSISLFSVFSILDAVSYDALDTFIGHAKLEDVLVKKAGDSGIGRLNKFQEAIIAWQTAPVFGIGLGNFGPHIASYPADKPPRGWEIVNNEYLELLAETGIVGLSAVGLLLVTVFSRSLIAYRASKDDYLKAILIGLTAALVGILVQYNFFSTLYIIHVWFLLGLIIGTQNLILDLRR